MNLVERTVHEFVDSVASVDEPVPAGGSVAALTGASSAALLALVSGVLERKRVAGGSGLVARARDLQDRLLALVDQDADAFRAYLQRVERALDRITQTPLDIAGACLQVVALSREVEALSRGPLLSDVHTARSLASAALMSAVDIAEQNVRLYADQAEQARVRDEIGRLRDAGAC